MKFSSISSLLLLLSTSSSYGFSHPTFLNPLIRAGGSSNYGIKSVSTTVEIETSPIVGMKPGTSGLRKKVEVWQGLDVGNKYYVENFIQSLIDTAKENNNGEQLNT